MYENFIKTPRLYVDSELSAARQITLNKAQSHYLVNVMRRKDGDRLRIFNGRNGEFGAVIESLSKKEVVLSLETQLKPQTQKSKVLHLIFAPIKKQRMDFMIEKAVELGATHLHPVITHHTEMRKLHNERVQAQIIEAAEQCERLDIPDLLPALPLESFINQWDKSIQIASCIARVDYAQIGTSPQNFQAVMIGPEGGFDQAEINLIKTQNFISPVSLGNTIMRAETAALYALSICKNNFDK